MIVVTPKGNTVDVPQPTQEQAKESFLVTLTGVDGSVWDLNNGPVNLLAGAKLFNTGEVTHWWRRSPMIDGARHVGMRTDEKQLVLPIATNGTDWQDWRDIDAAFFRAVAPEGEAVITVTAPDAVTRSMPVRFVSDGDVEDDFDPLLFARKSYELQFVGASPYWQGEAITKTFDVGDPKPWLVPSGTIYLNPPTITASATMPNPGDVDAWWSADVVAPFASFKVGVGTAVVSATTPFGAGQSVQILSDPRRRIILDEDGTRINALMDDVAFQPIPPGREARMTLAVTGSGPETEVSVTVVPLYRRPM